MEAVPEVPAHHAEDAEDRVENLDAILSLLDSRGVLSRKEHGEHGAVMGVGEAIAL